MEHETHFILNDQLIRSRDPKGSVVVDYIRKKKNLKGTVVACREGDCGACTVLVGECKNEGMLYRPVTSCIFPMLNIAGKHVVTIEGIIDFEQGESLRPIQKAFEDFGATQCGYCTPGFIMSILGLFLTAPELNEDVARTAVDGNICRCTGYKSIERVLTFLIESYQVSSDLSAQRIKRLIEMQFLPAYFAHIPQRLKSLDDRKPFFKAHGDIAVGGGTDLFVQNPEGFYDRELSSFTRDDSIEPIAVEDDKVWIRAHCRIEDLKQSKALKDLIPNIDRFMNLFASTQIRNMASVFGNIVNASPIGDVSNLLLALDAQLVIKNSSAQRIVPLRDFFLDYKIVDLHASEFIDCLFFTKPRKSSYIHLEKVSKRRYLDIASVTTSMHLIYEQHVIQEASFAAGGVAATPLYLKNMSTYLKHKTLTAQHVKQALVLANKEIQPISDIRGSDVYKRLLLRQLLIAHFITCFPNVLNGKDLL